MTEEELKAIAASLRLAVQDSTDNVTAWYSRGQNDAFDDLAALLAEVRRLRTGIENAVETACSSQPEMAVGELHGLLHSPSRVR